MQNLAADIILKLSTQNDDATIGAKTTQEKIDDDNKQDFFEDILKDLLNLCVLCFSFHQFTIRSIPW